VANDATSEQRGARPLKAATVALSFVLLLIPCFYAPAFFGLLPSSLRELQGQLRGVNDTAHASPSASSVQREFMTRYVHPGQEIPVFSARYDTLFYIETRTTNPVRAPGWNEAFLQSDVDRYAGYLAMEEPGDFLVSDEFAGAFPDLFPIIQEDYAETDRSADLARFERRHPAR